MNYKISSYLKNTVYRHASKNLYQIMQAITETCNENIEKNLQHAFNNMDRRVNAGIESEGRHFEHLPSLFYIITIIIALPTRFITT